MRRLVLVLAFLLAASPALAQREGFYDVAGTNLDGTPYTGVAQIRLLGINSFNIVWRLGNQLVEGVGMASGRTIAVVYGQAQRPGMGIYTLNPDGTIEGEWTVIGAGAIGRETLTPRDTPPPGIVPAPASPAPASPAAPGAAPRP
jgi:hypothetical protein